MKISVLVGLCLIAEPVSAEQKPVGLTAKENKEALQRMSEDELISKLQERPNLLPVVHRLRQKGDKKAIPALQEAFKKVSRDSEKGVIAAALVSLKTDDPSFWSYLEAEGKKAAESDLPYPLALDANGNFVRGKQSNEFLTWCSKHNSDPNKVAGDALYGLPSAIIDLSSSGDPRAIPILKKGLRSPNVAVVQACAEGLALAQDKSAINEIINAVTRLPVGPAKGLAQTLLYFDDPKAQEVGAKYIADEALVKSMRDMIKQHGVRKILGEQ